MGGPALLMVQASYYLTSGVWPLISMASFLRVTGPKHDLWLVRTVASLIIAIGITLAVAALQPSVTLPVLILSISSAAALKSSWFT